MATQTDRYFRASMGMKEQIEGDLHSDYHSTLVDQLKAAGNRLELPGVTVRLAREFGFCYGVDKAIDLAYEARSKFPGKRLFLTTEIIHNPDVNRRLHDMGIVFLSGQFKGELTPDSVTADDVVILPAFGVAVDELAHYRNKGAIVIDTTCGSVVHVWKRVERYALQGFTSLIHGKHFHEETIATASQARAKGGHYVIVRDLGESAIVEKAILGECTPDEFLDQLGGTVSPGFDPTHHLQRIGVANQTTMLATDSLAIARRIGEVMEKRYGAEHLEEHFRSFDTICSATQDRQDAVDEMIQEGGLDLMIIIGGYNSSNTQHLFEKARRHCPTYHISRPQEILSPEELRHRPPGAKEPITSRDWLPAGDHLTVGFTAGASTPNRAIGEAIERLVEMVKTRRSAH